MVVMIFSSFPDQIFKKQDFLRTIKKGQERTRKGQERTRKGQGKDKKGQERDKGFTFY